jgi:hypothetical protein
MFLPVPTWACYPCADDGVRSPTDNVPNWVEMATAEPLPPSLSAMAEQAVETQSRRPELVEGAG